MSPATPSTAAFLDQLAALYAGRGAARYEIGGAAGVSQLAHALQCAALAETAGADDPLVAAALLHDLGHLVAGAADGERDPGCDDGHETVGAGWLAPWFGAAVVEPIRLHVEAKRYLCAAEPGYRARLSPGSQRSLDLQGGAFDPRQASAFLARPYASEAVSLRRWDDRAKDPRASVPPFAYYLPLLRELIDLREAGSPHTARGGAR